MKIDTLILSGGGIKCISQLGAIKYLIENDMISEIKCSITLKNSKNFYEKISENYKIDIKYLKTKQ